jgi:hypothetical protein
MPPPTTAPTMTDTHDDQGETYYYLQCEYCGEYGTHGAPVADEDGNIVRLECSECGGTNWERQREAP